MEKNEGDKKNLHFYFSINHYSIILLFIFINILSFSLNQEKSQNIACSSVPFCQRLMFYNEDQRPIYFLDNKTITIYGNNANKNNMFKALLRNYNKEYIQNEIDLELNIFILKRGIFRIKIRPINTKKRFELNEEDDIFNMKETIKNSNIKISKGDKNIVIFYFSKKNKIKYELLINLSPL